MVHKRLLRPDRLRRVPSQFSWIDHRLVRERYIERLSAEACALYLFLITVGDAQGLSYYSDLALHRRLHLDPTGLERARRNLIGADLVTFERPLYQVLSLGGCANPERPPAPPSVGARSNEDGPRRLAEILRSLGEGQ